MSSAREFSTDEYSGPLTDFDAHLASECVDGWELASYTVMNATTVPPVATIIYTLQR